jgi:hypothetical protein
VDPRVDAGEADRVEQVGRPDHVGVQRVGRSAEARRHVRLRREVEDALGTDGLEDAHQRVQVAQLALVQRHATVDLDEVRARAAPAHHAVHLDVRMVREDVLGEVAAHHARDSGDQDPHRRLSVRPSQKGPLKRL